MNIRAVALAASIVLTSTYPGVQKAEAQDGLSKTGCIIIPQARNFRLELLVDGVPLRQMRHRGKTYVEAPWNKDFDIQITCPSNGRYLAVCSVDGLSIMNGKTASSLDDGYVIEKGSITIPGFRLNGSNVARFHFGDRSQSYANLIGKATNIGVIGLKIFADANRQQCYLQEDDRLENRPREEFSLAAPGSALQGGSSGVIRGKLLSDNKRGEITDARPLFRAQNELAKQKACGALANLDKDSAKSPCRGSLEHDIGTEFGVKTEFLTNEVNFVRGAQMASFAIEYASHDKLVQAGIIPRASISTHPNPFPADTSGCVPPPGWHG